MSTECREIESAFEQGETDRAVLLFKTRLERFQPDKSDMVELVVKHPQLLARHIEKGSFHNLLFIESTCELIEDIRFRDGESFSKILPELDKKSLWALVLADHSHGLGQSLSAETIVDLVGYKKASDLIFGLLSRHGDKVTPRIQLTIFNKLLARHVAKNYPLIEHLENIDPDLKKQWADCTAKAEALVERVSDRDNINYKNVVEIMDEFQSDEVRLGFLLDTLKPQSKLKLSQNSIVVDLHNAEFIKKTKGLGLDSYGTIATAQFINLVISQVVEFEPEELAEVAQKSDSFVDQIRALSRKEALPIVSIDPSFKLFHKIRWKDRAVTREIFGQELGL